MRSYADYLSSQLPHKPVCSLNAIVLAAGEGTRMKSHTPKVLHAMCGKTLLERVLTAVSTLKPMISVVVVRHQAQKVQEAALEINPRIQIALQDDIPGTGRAVYCGLHKLEEIAADCKECRDNEKQEEAENIIVAAADMPLLNGAILSQLAQAHCQSCNMATILTTTLDNPYGYGRIIRDINGSVLRITEEADATKEEREVKEVNTSVYIFNRKALNKALKSVKANNSQKEIYLTDVIEHIAQNGHVGTVVIDNPLWVEGVNTRQQLSKLACAYNQEICDYWMGEGVSIMDPATTWIEDTVAFDEDVSVLPGSFIQGNSCIEQDAIIGPYTTLIDTYVHKAATIERSRIQESTIKERAQIGPWSYLRPGNVIGEGAKAGSFVEMKKAIIDEKAKVPHLSYIGDTHIGARSNVGGGTITANYDGIHKNHTEIGTDVHVGAGNMFVAPVTVGNHVTTGAGSVVRHDVSDNSMVYSENTQHEVKDWELRRKNDPPRDNSSTSSSS